jgi:hypothetical protein
MPRTTARQRRAQNLEHDYIASRMRHYERAESARSACESVRRNLRTPPQARDLSPPAVSSSEFSDDSSSDASSDSSDSSDSSGSSEGSSEMDSDAGMAGADRLASMPALPDLPDLPDLVAHDLGA